jgi:hypothetical protein
MDATTSLLEAFRSSRLVDRRRAQGLRHPLPAILALTTVAVLTGIRSRAGVVQFGNAYGRPLLRLLGSDRRRAPSEATLCRVFGGIDAAAFEALIRDWIAARLGTRRFEHIALDGKTLRGSHDGALPAVHLLAAYAVEVQATLAQWRVDAKTNEHKAALELLGVLPVRGKVVTADAMFTHRDVCAVIGQRGGNYVLPVKENQPTLLHDIRAAFDAPPAGLSPPTAASAGREHRDGASAR